MSDVTPAPTHRDERPPARAVLLLSALVAISLSLFQLVTAGVIPVGLFYQRSIHLALILVLAFLLYPVFGRARRRGPLGWAIDGALIAGSALSGFYLSYNLEAIFSRAGFWTQTDISVGIITVVTLLEPTASTPAPDTLMEAGLSGVQKFFTALTVGAKNAIPVSVACALAGIVVGIISLTGLGLKFSSLMLTFSGGNLVLAILLVALASLVLGLGLPVTASYIVLAVLTAPALQSEFGVPIVIAHLLIFWYSQDSNVTPPVALAAFAAAGIAGSDPMRTGFAAWKFAKGLYLIPLFMVFNPEIILGGSPQAVAWNVLTAFAALGAFAAALEGFLFSYLNVPLRLLATAGTVAIFWPNIYIEAAGLAAIVLVLGSNYLKARREGRFARTEPAPSGA